MKSVILFVASLFSASVLLSQPVNDLCANATVLPVTTSCGALSATLAQATATGSPISPRGATTNDVWFRLSVTSNTKYLTISIPSRGSSLTNTNSFVEVYNTTDCSGLSVANMIASNNTQAANSIIVANAAAGTSLLVRVLTTATPSAATTWNFTICANSTGTAPGNNECANATPLTPDVTLTNPTIAYATASTGVPAVCSNSGVADDDVWFRFTATATTSTIAISNSTLLGQMGAMIQAFSGTCVSLSSLGCGRESLTLTGLSVGTQYYLRVYSFASMPGRATAAPVSANTFNISVIAGSQSNVLAGRMNEVFRTTNLSTSQILHDPWEVTYGPDDRLWVTEARGYKVFRINPQTGARTTVVDLWQQSDFGTGTADSNFRAQFNYSFSTWPQGGMAGLALHPGFTGAAGGQNFVYLAYVHSFNGGSSPTGIFFTNRLVRFTYNPSTERLESPVSICDTLSGSNDHNSQRIIIAREDGQPYLYYASGDVGSGQFGNRTRPIRAQVTGSYEGKILRFLLEPDGDAGAYDRWIPNNNPFNAVLGEQSAVWATGIRNNQGFAFNPSLNILYGSSHGPYSDDEINILESGRNYGHPLVVGFADNNYTGGVTAGSRPSDGPSTCPPIFSETSNAAGITNYQDPLFSAYAAPASRITSIWNGTESNGTWPSEGWSGLDLYNNSVIPGWRNSLVSASLKWGRLVRMRVGPAGNSILSIGGTDTASYFGSTNRFRDLAFHPNGRDIFVVMDRSATTSGPSAGSPLVPACGGCLQRYTFLGYNPTGTSPFPSTIPSSIAIDSATTNTCVPGSPVTISAANGNTNLWVPITGPNGDVVAEINANGNDLGDVTTSFFVKTGATRSLAGRAYMNRNITITPTVQPTSNVGLRLYFTNGELDNLRAADASITSVNDLAILKNNDPCSATYAGGTITKPVITGRFTQGTFGRVLQTNIDAFSTFYFGNASSTLPFRLIQFNAVARGESGKLNWEVDNDGSITGYEVERSNDNSRFEVIGTVQTRTQTTGTASYFYTDLYAARFASTVYYRLRVKDQDGSYKYTKTERVQFATAMYVGIFPNPATDKATLQIRSQVDELVQVRVTDNTGRTVLVRSAAVAKGVNNVDIQLQGLAAGLYHVDVTGTTISQKLKLIKR